MRYVISARLLPDSGGEWIYLVLKDGVWEWTNIYEEITYFTDIDLAVDTWEEIKDKLVEWFDIIELDTLKLRKVVFHNVVPLSTELPEIIPSAGAASAEDYNGEQEVEPDNQDTGSNFDVSNSAEENNIKINSTR